MKFFKFLFLSLISLFVLSCGKDDLSLSKEVFVNDIEIVDVEGDFTGKVNDTTSAKVASDKIFCGQGGGKADVVGGKIWCWENLEIPSYSGSKGVEIANGELFIDSECYEKQVSANGGKLSFRIDPSNPSTESWCGRDFNMRAEIRTAPWNIRHPKGTEEWFGWSYTFGDNYKIDNSNQWKFFQVHPGITGEPPQVGLEITHEAQFWDHPAGEIYVTNAGGSLNYSPTGVIPKAGQTINIVVHAIWGDDTNGLLQVWIDGQNVYDKQVSTVLADYPWGGNAKWGIYKWPWAKADAVLKSKEQGIEFLETYMGSLRIVTRKPGDADYMTDAYQLVAPN